MSRIERILIWSVTPYAKTAYGQQAGLLALELRKAGYEVTIASMAARKQDIGRPWRGIPVRYVCDGHHGATYLHAEVARARADLLLILCDSFMLDAHVVAELPGHVRVGYWCPVDGSVPGGGLPPLYRGMLRIAPRAVPIAMSRWAEAMFRHDGFDSVLFVPHMIDTETFRPFSQHDRQMARVEAGIDPGAFVIDVLAANSELVRKNYPGVFASFAKAAQDNWLLLVHTDCKPSRGGWNLEELAAYYGIAGKVLFADPRRYRNAGYTAQDLATWYSLSDLHSQFTLAEGFGIPLVESQACGVPAAATACSALTEMVSVKEWAVPGELFMSPLLRCEWTIPPRAEMASVYQQAAAIRDQDPGRYATLAAGAREFALRYSIDNVMAEHWMPALKALEAK